MKYTVTVETLKKMYKDKKIEISKVKQFLNNKIITLEEYNYILGKEGC